MSQSLPLDKTQNIFIIESSGKGICTFNLSGSYGPATTARVESVLCWRQSRPRRQHAPQVRVYLPPAHTPGRRDEGPRKDVGSAPSPDFDHITRRPGTNHKRSLGSPLWPRKKRASKFEPASD